MNEKQYTIKDIANMAGVSTGTVDRVLHNRGEVSESSKKKVQQVLKEIHYRPNMFAIGLAGKKKYLICCLIPKYTPDDYWSFVAQGIEQAAEELNAFHVRTEYIYYNHSSIESYCEAGAILLTKKPDAVLIAPNFKKETLQITGQLSERKIPFIFIDVNIEDAGAMMYIGQDSFQSGYIAGKILMNKYARDKEIVLFISEYNQNSFEIQMQRRLEGFMKYVSESCDHITIHEVKLRNKNDQEDKQILTAFFKEHPCVKMGISFNSRIYEVGQYLEENQIQFLRLIGYDLLPQNIELLNKGIITLLIGQRPGLQGYCAIKVLADKIVFKRDISPMKCMPIDLIIKENILYYVESYNL